MLKISGKTITAVCGDTATMLFSLANYTYQLGDIVYFSVKRKESDPGYVLQKSISPAEGTSEVAFLFTHEDTNTIPPGKYVYDIQVSLATGEVQTPLGPGTFILTGGVTHE